MTPIIKTAITGINETSVKIQEVELKILECKSLEDFLPIKEELSKLYGAMQAYSEMLQKDCMLLSNHYKG